MLTRAVRWLSNADSSRTCPLVLAQLMCLAILCLKCGATVFTCGFWQCVDPPNTFPLVLTRVVGLHGHGAVRALCAPLSSSLISAARMELYVWLMCLSSAGRKCGATCSSVGLSLCVDPPNDALYVPPNPCERGRSGMNQKPFMSKKRQGVSCVEVFLRPYTVLKRLSVWRHLYKHVIFDRAMSSQVKLQYSTRLKIVY